MNLIQKRLPSSRSSLFICALYIIHLSALIGVHLGYIQWFLSKTWAILFLIFLVLWDGLPKKSIKISWPIPAVFFIGFIAEWLGVKFGFLFGNYSYGANLGMKLDNVPIIMGINWVILSLATRGIIQRFFKLPIMKILVSSVLMVSLDVLLEPLAPQLDYWSFDTMVAPLSNYIGWLIYSILIQSLLELVQFKGHFKISLHILIIQLLFFGSLYFLF
ncbi:MAG: carotenoid biosynthesis protein [Flammeovirgaceae bacterium]|nr:carotenoid biosynthesis protein [Flammeovirgaceae bacterium]